MKENLADIERILISADQIAARIKEVAAVLDKDYAGKTPIAICILKGSVVFFGDLIRAMETPVELEFMKVSSYGAGTVSSGKLSVSLDILSNIQNRDVLIVEDIVDSGNTMYALKRMLEGRSPASVRIISLLDKPSRRTADITPDYTCFEIEDEFVIGYGLDYGEKYRDLPYVGILKRSVYEQN
ncbi:MAG: hypoxanthine phosphoribosyltransferase [Clostridiales bacterium]|jgi:hypoxanthine phosphoribosyltransferase|nr:hypoxanthine phosphoribosyltransferase [Clostridiales bacterium]